MLLSKDVIIQFWTDLHNSLSWVKRYSLLSFPGCGSFQALCLQKVLREGQVQNKYFLAWRNARSVLMHKGWLPLRNTNCLFLTNYIFVLVHHKIKPKENRNLKNLTLISEGNSVLKQKKKLLCWDESTESVSDVPTVMENSFLSDLPLFIQIPAIT